MRNILLYLHLGLGDHIMCHGIVREHCKTWDSVSIFSKRHDVPSVSFMYRDLKNLIIIEADDSSAQEYVRSRGTEYTAVKVIGYENIDRISKMPIERQYYDLAGIGFSKRWDSFLVIRDPQREEALWNILAPHDEYVFLHEDASRNFIIQRKWIDQKYRILQPDPSLTNNIFDYCKLLEKASEIHVIDSSFMFLIESLPYVGTNQRLFVHRYSRENPVWKLPTLRKNWRIIGKSTLSFTDILLKKIGLA